ncbi:MAG: tRNA adenosine(34) deaminase TadA [Candidatus Dormibacteraeota bacterium]|nr:tRNA adenosine(34) deaminase TadA [Candidatus Dormibacteraeota bacterium]
MRAAEDRLWMTAALRLAIGAGQRGEVPVGAIAVHRGRRVAAASNRMERSHDSSAHAELACLRRASRHLESWRLEGVTLYATLEPCPMCASAMVLARLERLVYAAADPKKGADGSAYRLLDHPANNHRVEVTRGVLKEEASALMGDFFRNLRQEGGRLDP